MKRVLVIVDMQRDFVSGSLPVPGAGDLVPHIRELALTSDLVIATRDWHPINHCSFKPRGPWPAHCVAGTKGSQLLRMVDEVSDIVINKGMDPTKNGYSAFDNPFLNEILFAASAAENGWTFEVVFAGVARNVCVQASALDARDYGWENVIVPLNCTASIGDDTDFYAKMKDAYVKVVERID